MRKLQPAAARAIIHRTRPSAEPHGRPPWPRVRWEATRKRRSRRQSGTRRRRVVLRLRRSPPGRPATSRLTTCRARKASASRCDPCYLARNSRMLSERERRFLAARRVGYLATADGRAIPHVVPVCFAISDGTLYITVDEKPKRAPGAKLKRVRNIEQ